MASVIEVEPTSIAEKAAEAAGMGGAVWVQYGRSSERGWRVKITSEGDVTLVVAPTDCWEPVIEDGMITGMRPVGDLA